MGLFAALATMELLEEEGALKWVREQAFMKADSWDSAVAELLSSGQGSRTAGLPMAPVMPVQEEPQRKVG